MSRSGAASDLAIGKKFTKQLLYVQHVDKEKDTDRTISEQSLHEYFLNNSQIFSDSRFAEYLLNPKANVDILKSSLQDEIVIIAHVCTNPLPAIPQTAVTIHAFVVLMTHNLKTNNFMYYSMEKNGQYIVLQQSPIKDDVEKKLYDPEEKKLVKRLGPVKLGSFADGNEKHLEDLLRAIWETNQLNTPYHILFSNCQNFAEFVFEEASSFGGKGYKWSTWISRRFGLRNKKSQIEIEADTLNYYERKDAKFAFYKAMAEGRRQDFEELAGNLTNSESLNNVDSQGYTLLEWATVFSTSDWPIDQFLREKGAEIQTDDEGLFRQNVFFIALQYLPSKKESRFLSFDGIDIRGVNSTGDTALHLAFYGEKWDVAERILDQFPDYDVNATNSEGETALHLAVHPKCEMDLIKKILARRNSESVNAQNEGGETTLHYAFENQSEIAVKEMLKRDDVKVNLENNKKITALLGAIMWKNMPIELFRKILEKSINVNAQDERGRTALHLAILLRSETAVKELLKRKDVDVNLKDNKHRTALHRAAQWVDMPINLFRIILEKSADVNAQDEDGDPALHWAIIGKNITAVKELLKRKDVDVNVKNKNNQTALHSATSGEDFPMDWFREILKKSTDVNAQDKNGHTALHYAIRIKFNSAVKELLKRKDVLDVNVKNKDNQTALHFTAIYKTPIDLFRVILKKSADVVNAQDEDGWTALHFAIREKNETAVEELLKRSDVDVNLKKNNNETALHYACCWKDLPINLFTRILEKSTDVNAQNEYGNTALHWAISLENRTAVEELLKRDDVNVNLKNNYNQTALNLCSAWKGIPANLLKIINDKTTAENKAETENEAT